MPKLVVEPLPEGCPWSGWTPPNVDWCEEELCDWIVNPADTWSNLAYLFFGGLMWWAAKRSGDERMALFGPASIVVAAGSFAYHASYTYFLQFFDFVGMFLFCFTVITANALRLGWVEPRRQWAFLIGGTVGFSALVPIVSETSVPIQSLVALLIVTIIGQEGLIRVRQPAGAPPVRYGLFAAALALIAAAGLSSLADVTRTVCDPTNHFIQGHALWHVLSACSLYALYLFYASMPGRRKSMSAMSSFSTR
jgi:hypothetical protein